MVTIKDIARRAQVSHTTVSRALNDSPLINPETKEKIKAIAKELNYTPNYNAKSLVLHRSYNLGLFFSTLDTGTSAAFFYEVVRGVNEAVKEGYNLIVKGIDDYSMEGTISRRQFDGIIVMSQSPADDNFILDVQNQGIPLVVLNRRSEGTGTVNLLSDDRRGAFKMTEYLIRQGHRRIAIIEGKPGFQSTQERKAGYLDALAQYGIEPAIEWMVKGKYDLESGYLAMGKLLEADSALRATAVFCSNDDMAVGAYRAIHEQGLQVPDDISVTGFDDNVFAGYLFPALTTVKRPIETISREGARRLLRLIGGDASGEPVQYIHTELVIRRSVGRC